MEILVTGASGVLGRKVARIAEERGYSVRRLSRSERDGPGWYRGEVASGDGLTEAVAGADAIIHCASDPRHHAVTDVAGTANLVRTALTAGGIHIVYPGIVGSDVIPYPYYRSKTAAETVLSDSGDSFTIQRYTQFHDLVWHRLSRRTKLPVVAVPNDTRFQVLDATAAARHLVDAAEGSPAGRLPDLGGPTVYDVRDLARSVAAGLGRRRWIFGINYRGLVGAAFRAGANLTENRDDTGMTWNEYVASRIG